MSLHITSLVLFSMMLVASLATTEFLALPGCPGQCGNLSIPFPFGSTSDCYLDDRFLIICNRSYSPPKPFLGHAEVLSISLDGKMKILNSSRELMELGKRDRGSLSDFVVIEWAAGNVACHTATDDASHYACQSQHSKCTDSSIGRGHICHCLAGYEGNPYLPDGCQDIDECAVLEPCEHVCINIPGSFKCYCPEGLTGDGRKDGSGCHQPKDQFTRPVSVPIYFLSIIVLAPAILSTWIIWIHKEKKLLKHREKVFEQNGGNLWKRKVSMLREPARRNARLYTADDMRKATNNYSEQMMYNCTPGRTRYRGRLAVNGAETEVVVMKIPRVPSFHTDHFIDQLIILSQPHNNLVKLIGCCLETESPLLVYEFHGESSSLFDRLHDEGPALQFLGEQRVKVAAEVSRGLEYLHSKNSRSIVHGDVTSANIFLSDSNDAKLFYVAASDLTPQENSVHRPPEFSTSGHLNRKSDVYSFGHVLTELLPGWETTAPTKNKSNVKEDIALLAAKCLSEKPGDRPKMKEVEAKLDTLMNQR